MIILDIEASGLGDESYPIEVAWINRANCSRWDSFLIRPAEGWTHWDAVAEQLHGIPRETLFEQGLDVEEAVGRLDEALAGETVYSDGVQSDRPWMMRLYRAAGRGKLSFRFAHLQSLLPPDKVSPYFARFHSSDTHHRALDDVEKMIKILDYMAPL